MFSICFRDVCKCSELVQAYGMRMGPLRMMDLVGLDLFGRERAKSGLAQPQEVVFDAMLLRPT